MHHGILTQMAFRSVSARGERAAVLFGLWFMRTMRRHRMISPRLEVCRQKTGAAAVEVEGGSQLLSIRK